jgi:two-component system cell cycle sensor histidine kinase PleC
VTAEDKAPSWNTSSWSSGWRLVALFFATILMATAAALIYEFWLQPSFFSNIRGIYSENLAERLTDVLETAIITAIAISGPAVLLFRGAERLRRASEKLRLAFDAAESANIAKSQFLANMSHELRTPLNAVIGFAGFMETQPFGPLLPRYRGYAVDIKTAGLHLLNVINDVLDISKAEAAKLTVHMADVDLGGIFAEVEMLAAGFAADAAIALHFEMPGNSGRIMVKADDVRLKQALLNLVSNGIKFNRTGGQVTVRAFTGAGTVRIEVQDSGIGMKPDEIAEAFQPFVQLHTGHSRKYEGTGLGLPLTKLLIEAMQGSIAVVSEVGVGSRVTVTLAGGVAAGVAQAA